MRNYALLFCGCVLFHIVGTWSLPLIDRDEPRFAEASREMIERNNYVVPHFNNQYRFDKPPLAYWAQVVSFRMFGQNDFAARFPSTIAAALTALSIFAWAKRIGGDRLAWWSAIVFTLSLQVFLHAKAAVTDMWLVLFVTTAHWSGYELLGPRVSAPIQTSNLKPQTFGIWWFVFYISLALGFLAKGPVGLIPLLTVAVMRWQDRQLDLGKRFRFAPGIALTLGIILLWAIPAYLQTNGEFWRVGLGKHVIARSFGAMESHGGKTLLTYLLFLPFYVVTIFITFLPWSIKLPSLLRNLSRTRRTAASGSGYSSHKIDNYLIAGIGIVFLIFTLAATKLPHYILPAFPLLAVLLARHLIDIQFTLARFKAVALAMAVVWVSVAFIVPPLIAAKFPARELLKLSQNNLRPEMEFAAVEYAEPSLVWYFRSRIHGWMTELNRDEAQSFMGKPGARFVILPAEIADKLFPNQPADWKTFSTRGVNVAKGKDVDLTVILKPQ